MFINVDYGVSLQSAVFGLQFAVHSLAIRVPASAYISDGQAVFRVQSSKVTP